MILMKLEFSQQFFEKYSNIKFHENLSSGSRVVPCRRMEMTKLIATFSNFANVPKKLICRIGLTILIAKRQAKLIDSYH